MRVKGQISINLTWVFAILAGIAVFAFIINFSGTAQEQEELETGANVLTNLKTEITTLAKTGSTFQEVSTPEIDVEILCEEPFSSGLMLERAESVADTRAQPIYSPGNLKGKTLYAWTQDWTIHTPIDRFLYLATPKTLFVVINDSGDYSEDFMTGFPDEFETDVIERVDVQDYERQGYDHYRFIYFGGADPSSQEPAVSGDVVAVHISPGSARLFSYGTASFYSLGTNGFAATQAEPYHGSAMLYGAVFSGDHTHYTCNQEKSVTRLESLMEVNVNRTEKILDDMDSENECRDTVEDLKSIYEQILEASRQPDVAELHEQEENLREAEQDLKTGEGCPTL